MYRLSYFPFDRDEFRLTMDARALGDAPLIEVGEGYHEQIALKARITAEDYPLVFHAPPETEPLQWEMLDLLLSDMARQYPDDFEYRKRAGGERLWINRLLSCHQYFTPGDPATLPLPPLEWIGRQVQEDLLLMEAREDGETVLVAGHVCFPSKWSLREKIGQTFLEIHEPVPGFGVGPGRAADTLMRRLKAEVPITRVNGSVAPTDRLDLLPERAADWNESEEEITAENAGERCFLRMERQTLTRLPESRGILFTIRVYLAPVSDLVGEPEKLRRFAGVVKTMPPETLEYKGMTRYVDALIGYLDRQLDAANAAG